jgi:hypothetical protein
MSFADSYRREIQKHNDEISRFQRQKADEAKNAANYAKKAADARQSALRASSPSSVKSYLHQAERYESDHNRALTKISDYEKRIATTYSQLASAQQKLAREEASDVSKRQRQLDATMREHERTTQAVSTRLERTATQQSDLHDRIRRLEALPEKIVVLFLAANPIDADALRLDEEARAIAETIRKSKHRDAVKLESCWAVRPTDVLQAINEHRPHIVHFSGHGSDQEQLVFQDEQGFSKFVSKDAMTQVMAACSGEIQLVFFNACFSQAQAEAVVQHVNSAIGMRIGIGDEAARVFAAQFYSAIGFGKSVKEAFEQARALVMLEGIGEQDTPVLFARTGVDLAELRLVCPPQ